jgi:hypothetical protein
MRAVLLFALLLLFAPRSSATIIDFTFSGTDSGTIGRTAFSDAAFAIGGEFNTANLRPLILDVAIALDDFTFISISGVGVFEFITPITFLDQFIESALALQYRSTATSGETLLSAISPVSVFASWGVNSPLGPVTVRGNIFNWSNVPIETTGGVLVLNDEGPPITFQAVLADAPEPSSRFLVGFGIIGAVLLRIAVARSGTVGAGALGYETMHATLPKSS